MSLFLHRNTLSTDRRTLCRESQPIITRVEHVLEALIGQPTLIYPSGVAAFYAALLLVRPDVLAAGQYYGGCRAAFEIYQQTRGADQVVSCSAKGEKDRRS